MMDHLSEMEAVADVNSLRNILKQDDKISEVLKRSEFFETFTQEARYQVEWTNSFYRVALIFAFVLNNALQLDASFASRLHKALKEELYDVC